MKVSDKMRVSKIPSDVKIPKTRTGATSIATNDNRLAAVVSPAVTTTGPVCCRV